MSTAFSTRAGAPLSIEVVYALPQASFVRQLSLPRGSRIEDAIAASGVCVEYPEINAGHPDVGIWGRRTGPDELLSDGDRVEIYRPLLIDPNQARRERARKAKSGR